MTKTAAFFRTLALLACTLLPTLALADSWPPPTRSTSTSSNGAWRVTIDPKPWGEEAAKPGARQAPHARVERLVSERFVLAWEQPLLNRLAPTDALIADDGAFLVTFDNWGTVGTGDTVVVIYRRGGELVRKFSLRDFLPADYVRYIPRSVSSVWWGGKHRLVDRDTVLELQVVEPGSDSHASGPRVPVRIRLADGEVSPPEGEAWSRAQAKLQALDAGRQAKWDEHRRMRASPLRVPESSDHWQWQAYVTELGTRLFGDAPGSFEHHLYEDAGRDPEDAARHLARWVAGWDTTGFPGRKIIFLSPVSDRLAPVLADALKARAAGSLQGMHLVFVGTTGEGTLVQAAAAPTGARLTFVDRSAGFPPGAPLPANPPDDFPDPRNP